MPFRYEPDGDDNNQLRDIGWDWRIHSSGEVISLIGEGENNTLRAGTFQVLSYRLDGDRSPIAEISTDPIPRNEGVARKLWYKKSSRIDSQRIFGTVNGIRVDLWDLATGERFPQPLFAPEILANATLTPDGRHVVATSLTSGFSGAAGSAKKEIFVFDVFTGRLVFPQPIVLESSGTSLFFSPDGETLFTEDKTANKVQFWDLGSGREVRTPVDAWTVEDVLFSSRGNRIVIYQKGSTFYGGNNRFMDLTTGEFLLSQADLVPATPEILTEEQRVGGRRTEVSAPPTGGTWMTIERPSNTQVARLQFWDAGRTEVISSLEFPTGPGLGSGVGVGWSDDGSRMIFGTYQSRALLVETESGNVLHEFDLDQRNLQNVAISGDGSTAACVTAQGFVTTWSEEDGEATFRPFGLDNSNVDALRFNDSGSHLAVSHRNDTIRYYVVVDARTGEACFVPREVANAVHDFVFSPDDRHLIVSVQASKIPMVEVET
ncbi:MAG: WD40 repeat domain-containing protein, partial [Akkermansiaceae bacterium]|nr:WD40 repeat domain-containing protein [Akkermansiaceae bacterium]